MLCNGIIGFMVQSPFYKNLILQTIDCQHDPTNVRETSAIPPLGFLFHTEYTENTEFSFKSIVLAHFEA